MFAITIALKAYCQQTDMNSSQIDVMASVVDLTMLESLTHRIIVGVKLFNIKDMRYCVSFIMIAGSF